MHNLLKTAKTGYLSRINPLLREFTISDFMDLTIETNSTSAMDLFLFGTNVILVDWGDGSDPELIKGSFNGSSQPPFNSTDAFKYTHTYSSAGIYQVRIQGFIAYANLGLFSRFKQYYDSDLEQFVTINENNTNIKRIVNFSGTAEDLSSLFASCTALDNTNVPFSGLVNVNRMHSTFSHCDSLEFFDSSGLNSLEIMDYMFYDSSNISGVNFDDFNNVNSANRAFERSYDLEYADMASMSGLQYANRMFHASFYNPANHIYTGKGSLASGEFESLSGLLEAEAMFFNQSLTDSSFVQDCGSLTDANHMFENNLINGFIDFNGLDSLQNANDMYHGNSVSGVNFNGALSIKNINSIFEDNNLTEVDLSPITTASNFNRAFADNQISGVDLSVLSTFIDLRSFNQSFYQNSFTNIDQELSDLFSLTNAPNLYDIGYMFANNTSIGSVDLSPMLDAGNLSGITSMRGFLFGMGLTSIDLSPISGIADIPNTVAIDNFLQSNSLTSVDMSPVSSLTNTNSLASFLSDNQLSGIDLSFLNSMHQVTNLQSFLRNNNLTNSTDFTPIGNMPNVSRLDSLLYNNNLTSADLDHFIGNTNVTNISFMFYNNNLSSVDLSRLNDITYNFLNTSYTFANNSLTSIDTSHLRQLYNAQYMFQNNDINVTITMNTGTYELELAYGMFQGNNISVVNIPACTQLRDIAYMFSGNPVVTLVMPTSGSVYRAQYFLNHDSLTASIIDGFLVALDNIVQSRPGYNIGDTVSPTSSIYNFQYNNSNNTNTLDTSRSAAALTAIQSLKDKGWVRGVESNY